MGSTQLAGESHKLLHTCDGHPLVPLDRWLTAVIRARARITPGITEFIAPIVWIVYGLICYGRLMAKIDGEGQRPSML